MYLSRLFLDPANRQVRAELSNRYQLHRTLLAQFDGVNRNEIGLLFRIEPEDLYTYQPITLLVQTQIKPCWDDLLQRGVIIQKAETKTYNLNIQIGNQYYFRLLANPTLRKTKGDWAGKRVELRTTEEYEAWLTRKGKNGGFTVKSLSAIDKGKIISQKFEDGKKHVIQHQAVLFEGVLEITDFELFRKTIENGIGSAKGFGFGLLSIARQ